MNTYLKIIAFFIGFVYTPILFSQDVKWIFRESGTTGYHESGDMNNTLVVDRYKNVYTGPFITDTTVAFNGNCTINNITGYYENISAFCKMDSNLNCVVSKYVGDTGTMVRGINVDAGLNMYVAGTFFGNQPLCSSVRVSVTSGFVAKYNSSGSCLWYEKASASGGVVETFASQIDNNGNVYIAGEFQGTATFGSATITSNGLLDGFIAKYDNNGNLIWVKGFGGPKNDVALGISNIANGVLYITGQFDSTAYFGSNTVTNKDSADVFLAKIDTAGNFQWVRSGGSGNDNEYGTRVQQDQWGNVFLAGTADSGATFGTLVTSRKAEFLARYNSSGQIQWLQMMGTESGQGTAFTANYLDMPSVAIYDSCVAFVGSVYGSFTVGSFTTSNFTNQGVVVGRFDYNGNPLWLNTYGSSGTLNSGSAITFDSAGAMYVSGEFSGTLNFGGKSVTVNSSGNGNIYVTKMVPPLVITQVSGGLNMVCRGSNFNVSFSVDSARSSGNIFSVQLSDTNGNFGSPVTIGRDTATTSGTVSCVIPATVAPGSKYRLRVVASTPSLTGEVFFSSLRISADTPATPTSVTPSVATNVCNGQSINLSAVSANNNIYWYTQSSGGTAVAWSGSGANASVTPTGTTTYYAQAEDGCINPTRIATGVISLLSLPANPGNPTSNSPQCSSTGVILTRSGSPTTGQSWFWESSYGSTATTYHNSTDTVTASGIYYIYSRNDSTLCWSSGAGSAVVTVNPTPPAPTSVTPSSTVNDCSSSAVTINVFASSIGNTIYWYRQSTGGTAIGDTASGISYPIITPATDTAVMYYAEARTSAGCASTSRSATAAITVGLPANPGNPTSNSPQCANVGVTLTRAGTPPSGQTWYWQTNSAGTSTTNSGSTYLVTTSGNYYIRARDNNTLCWSAGSGSIAVTVNANPAAPTSVTPSSATSVCAGNSLYLNATSSGNTINWCTTNTGGTLFANSASATNYSYAPPSTGAVYAETKAAGTGCLSTTRTATATITVNPLPTDTPSSNSPVCVGQALTLTGRPNSMSSYSWHGPSSYSSSSQNPTVSSSATTGMAGTYTLTVTNSNGCSSSASTNVTVNTLPSATASNSGPYCSYGTISLSGGPNGMTNYSWSGPNSFTSASQNPTLAASGNGATYTLTVTNSNGCSASASTRVTVNTAPTASASNNSPVCNGQTLSLTGGPDSMTSYSWSGPSSFSSTSQSPTVSSSAATSMNGTYVLTVTNSNSCSASISTSVIVNALPSVPTAPSAQGVCSDTAYTFVFSDITAGTGGNEIEWATNSNFTSSVNIGIPGNISITVSPGSTDTIWMRSKESITGCTSGAVNIIAKVNPLPRVSVTPSDTIVLAGDTITMTASGGVEYFWRGLSRYSSEVNVASHADSTIYWVVGLDSLGCSDSSFSIVRTADSLILSVVSLLDTIYPFQTTTILASSNLPGIVITWHRDNSGSVSGDTVGTGSINHMHFVNLTNRNQSVHFRFKGEDGGDTVYADAGVNYAPSNEINITINSNNFNACLDTLLDTITLYNINSATGFNIYQSLPVGAIVFSAKSSCPGISDTLYYNHIYHENVDSINWAVSAGTIDTCILTAAIGFDCSYYQSNEGVNGLNTTTNLPPDSFAISGNGYSIWVWKPGLTIQNITPASSVYALIGDEIAHRWKICDTGSSINNLTLTYKPENATNSPSIILAMSGNMGQMIKHLTGQDTSYTFSVPLDSLIGQKIMTTGQCIYVQDTAIAIQCSTDNDQDILEASFACAFGGSCFDPVISTANVFIHDDFDNSAISIDTFQLWQGNADVTSVGISPCDTQSCSLKYIINNPERKNDSLPTNGNFKILNTFSTFISSCWFNIDSMHIYLCDSAGNNCVLLSGSQYSYIEPGDLTISFNNLGASASNLFSNPPSIYSDSSYNEMHENSKFTISITGLVFNQTCGYLSSCTKYNGSIIGLGQGSMISYHTMCGDSFTQSLSLGNYVNVVETSLDFNATADVQIGHNVDLNFGWQDPNGGNAWNFRDIGSGNLGNPLFNCPDPVYSMNIFVPTDFNYIFNTDSVFFKTGTGILYQVGTSQIYGPVSQIMQGDTFNVYTIKNLFEPGNVIVPITFEGGLKCHGQGGYDTAYAEIFAVCGETTCQDVPYCIAIEPNQFYYHCQGQCEYPIGLDSTNPITVQRIYIPSEHIGSGARDSSQAYPADTVMVTVKGFANHNYMTGIADSIYLRITYDPDPYIGTVNSLFSVTSAEYSVDAVSWAPVASTSGPILFYDTAYKAQEWLVDANLPGGCDSNSVSSIFMLNDTVFYIRVKLIVSDTLPFSSNNGIYNVDNIRADMRVMSCDSVDYHSCDTYAGNETLIQHQYIVSADFLAPDDPSSDNAPKVNICTQRLVVVTEAIGGFTQKREMPNEKRPLIVWPDNSGPGDTLQLVASPASMVLESAKFRGPNQSSSYSPVGIAQNSTAASLLGIDTTNAWPNFVKDTVNLLWMQLEATFDKLDCAGVPQTDSLRFNYWIRGQGNQYLSASDFFHDPLVRDTDIIVSTYPTSDSITMINEISPAYSGGPYYATNSGFNPFFTNFTFNSIMQYAGRAAGANYTWIYAQIPPEIAWLKLHFPSNSVDSIISQVYDSTGPFILPPGIDTVTFEVQLNNYDACIDTLKGFAIKFYTGYSCDPSAIPTSITSLPSDTNSFNCGITRSSISIYPYIPYFDFSGDTLIQSGDFCSDFVFPFQFKSPGAGTLFNPADTVWVPAKTILKSVSIALNNYDGSTVDSAIDLTGGNGILYSCTDSMQALLYRKGDTLNGNTYLPTNWMFTITATFTGVDNSAKGTILVQSEASGKNMCLATLATQYEDAYMVVHPLTIDSFNSVLCTGQDSLSVHITSEYPNYHYSWSGPSFVPGETNTAALSQTVLITDTGTYYVTVTDQPGCSVADSIHITQVAPVYPGVNAGPSTSICAGDSIFLDGSDSAAITIIWSTSGDGNFSDSTVLNPTYTPGDSDVIKGGVILKLTASGTPSCITISDTMVLTITPLVTPTVILRTPYAACSGDAINLIADITNGGDVKHYIWYVNNKFDSVTLDQYSDGHLKENDSVYCIMTSSAACASPDSVHSNTVIVHVNPLPPATISINKTNGSPRSDTICTGDSLILTANPTNGMRYQWSITTDNTDNITVSPTNDTNYTVTVINSTTGCSASDTATIVVNLPPMVTITERDISGKDSNDNLICSNDSSILWAIWQSGMTYQWSGPDGGGTTDTIIAKDAGVYQIMVTNSSTGCSAAASDTINVYPALSISLSVNGDTLSADFGISWLWNTGDTAATIFVTPQAGEYSVIVTDSNKCKNFQTYTVGPLGLGSVCVGNYNYTFYSDTITSLEAMALAHPLIFDAGNTIALNGQFTVGGNITINNTSLYLSSGSSIAVQPGENLTLHGSTIEGCVLMWDGVYVDSGGVLTVDQPDGYDTSYIADAMNGIVLYNNSIAYISNTKFYRNLAGIELFNRNVGICSISGNTFALGNLPMKDYSTELITFPIDGAGPGHYKYTHPAVGISLSGSYLFIPDGDRSITSNTFQDLNCAINAVGACDLNVYNNTFRNIRNYETCTNFDGSFGSAIFTSLGPTAKASYAMIEASSSVPDSTSPVTFQNCDVGIKAIKSTINIQRNRMDNVATGILLNNCIGSIEATENYITRTSAGITLNNSLSNSQNVGYNTIYLNDPVYVPVYDLSATPTATYGIQLNDAGAGGGTNIYDNHIWNGGNGIYLNNTNTTQVFDNDIHLTSNTAVLAQQSGIYGVNCTYVLITGNEVYGNSTRCDDAPLEAIGNSAHRKMGIYLSNTQTGTVCGNTLGGIDTSQGIGHGMNFTSNCQYLRVRNNIMNQSKYGIALSDAGSKPILPDEGSLHYSHGNQFHGDGSGTFIGGYRTYTFQINKTRPIFYYHDSIYETTNPSGATDPGNEIIAIQSDSASDTLCLTLVPPVKSLVVHPLQKTGSSSKDSIALGHTDSLMQAGYETTGPWLAKRMLYSFLSDTVFPASRVSALPKVGDILLMQQVQLQLMTWRDPDGGGGSEDTSTTTDSSSLALILNPAYQTDSLLLLADETDSVDSALVIFYAAMQSTDISAIQGYLGQLQNLRNSTIQSDTLLYDSAWLASYTLNEAIPDANIQAANFKTVQRIYLHMAARNDTTVMDSSTLATLHAIAMQCPYAAGDAVYSARALYAQYVDTLYYDDIVLCTSPLTQEAYKVPNHQDTTSKANEFAKVYPNPARDIINLVYLAQTTGTVEFEMINQLGQVVMKQNLRSSQNSAQYSTGSLANGIYYWRLRDSQRTIQTDKVAIIK